MSKRNKPTNGPTKSPMSKDRGVSGRAPVRAKNVSQATAKGKQAHGGTAKPYSYNRAASNRPTSREMARPNMLTARIVAIVVAVAAVAGGILWALSIKGSYGAWQIVGLVVLGFLAGLSLLIAVRTEDVVTRALKYMQR
jgi:hypothetical protein